jgi:hypothetical protein
MVRVDLVDLAPASLAVQTRQRVPFREDQLEPVDDNAADRGLAWY